MLQSNLFINLFYKLHVGRQRSLLSERGLCRHVDVSLDDLDPPAHVVVPVYVLEADHERDTDHADQDQALQDVLE